MQDRSGDIGYGASDLASSSTPPAAAAAPSSWSSNNPSVIHAGRRVTSQSSIASSTTGYPASAGGARMSYAANSAAGVSSQHGASSSSTSRSGGGHLESTSTKLLVATKQLLEGLTDWSQGKINEEQVSDIYVRLGNCFNAAVAAFAREGISMKDVKDIPQILRLRLEAAINEEASPATLSEHLPKIRPVIMDLLTGLREKQDRHTAMLAARAGGDRSMASPTAEPSISDRQASGKHSSILSQSSQSSPYQANGSSAGGSGAASINVNARARQATGRLREIIGEDGKSSFAPSSNSQPSLDERRPSNDRMLLDTPTSTSFPDGYERRAASDANYAVERRPSSDSRPQPPLQKSKSSSSMRSNRSNAETFRKAPDLPLPAVPPAQYSAVPITRIPRAPLPLPGTAQLGATAIVQSNSAGSSLPDTSLPGITSPASPTNEIPNRLQNALATPPRSVLRPQQKLRPPADDVGLEALKKADPLSRRASKRFSQYTMNKMSTSASMGVVSSPSGAAMSAALGTTLPNRAPLFDKDDSAREYVTSSAKSDDGQRRRGRKSPSPKIVQGDIPDVPSLPPIDGLPVLSFSPDPFGRKRVSVVAEVNEDEADEQQDYTPLAHVQSEQLHPNYTARRPSSASRRESVGSVGTTASAYSVLPPSAEHEAISIPTSAPTFVQPIVEAQITLAVEPMTKTVYLQLGRDMKKAKLDADPLPTISTLRTLFTDRFAYNPGLADFPSIYLRDPTSGVQYELEDLSEIRDHSVLSLNVEPLDQVKQHIDDGLAVLSRELKELKTALNSSRRASVALPVPNLVIPTAASPNLQDLRRGSASVPATSALAVAASHSESENPDPSPDRVINTSSAGNTVTGVLGTASIKLQLADIQTVRREVAALRQIYQTSRVDTAEMLLTLRTQTERVKDMAASNVGGTRAFIDSGKTRLDNKSQDLLTKIEELQDSIDDLKNDVTTRRIKPKPRQLENIQLSIKGRHSELEDLTQYIATVKPMWKKTWEAELQNIVEEQQLLNHQEELLTDLKADHDNVVTIFDQIQQYVSMRQASSGRNKDFRPPSPDPGHEGLRTVMLEVKGLAADPDKRMKAIEQAEKARTKDAANKTDEFAHELGGFVEGRKLRKTGGAEEAERLRQIKSEASLRAMFKTAPVVGPVPSAAPIPAAQTLSADHRIFSTAPTTPKAETPLELPASKATSGLPWKIEVDAVSAVAPTGEPQKLGADEPARPAAETEDADEAKTQSSHASDLPAKILSPLSMPLSAVSHGDDLGSSSDVQRS